MDECDTAARVMDCGKNADALVFKNMVASVDLVRVVWPKILNSLFSYIVHATKTGGRSFANV